MRPATPKLNLVRQADPSSPPATPTTTTSKIVSKKSRRQGVAQFHDFPTIPSAIYTNGSTITPTGSGTTFSYNRFEPLNLSPRSSSPASSHHSTESEAVSVPARSRSTSPANDPISESPPKHARIEIIVQGNFTVEEFRDSDYEGFDSDSESVLRPHQYEDAESEKARSTRASSPRHELDDNVVNGLRDLDCGTEEDGVEEHQAWLEKYREERRRRRRSSASVQKRSLAQSIGSDTDDEDLQPVIFDGANEAGSSARRLRRKVVGERTSLIFDDPPVGRIEEVEEPDSEEEAVVVGEVDEGSEQERRWHTQMPFYGEEEMDVDSDEDD